MYIKEEPIPCSGCGALIGNMQVHNCPNLPPKVIW